MKQMPPIHAVLSPPTTVQAIPKVVVLRDKMYKIVDHINGSRSLCVCIVIIVYVVLMK
jgi:hypothetical protein